MIILLLLLTTSSFANSVDFSKDLEHLKKGPDISCDESETTQNLNFKLDPIYSSNGADCSKFIRPSGELGDHGKVIVQSINSINGSKYFDNDIGRIREICPNWNSLNKTQKDHFWVWFFAAIAWKESTCIETAINRQATNGTAVGYLQLDELRKNRYWRGGDSGKSCGASEVRTASNNLKCSVEIFNELMKGKSGVYKTNGNIFGTTTYWQDLKKNNNRIINMAKKFPGCS